MWRLGFFFHEMAFGLLSVFLPLYIVAIGGSLVDLGVMSSMALFLAIPASYFWGYMCDKTRRYKRCILISFLAMSVILYLFTFRSSVSLVIILYSIMSIFHVANEPPKNVLISELYSREEWEKTFALYEGFTEIGWLIGLFLGFLASNYQMDSKFILLMCSSLNFAAFVLSSVLVADPIIVFERSLVNIERAVEFAYNGLLIASKILDGATLNEKLKKEHLSAFCCGLVLFSLATSILFTPLPIFLSRELSLSTSIIFTVYILNSGGGIAGYFLASKKLKRRTGKPNVNPIVISRSLLAFLLAVAASLPMYGVALTVAILILMGFAYALFLVFTLSLSMELIPAGRAGLFNVLVGVGGACGSFIGPFIAQTTGFNQVFLLSGTSFFLAYIFFKIFL
ncbi:MAG: MFS transporter [Candidatus Bathyarchaeia archaeon]